MAPVTYSSIIGNYKSSWHIPYDILLTTKEWFDFRTKILERDLRICTRCKRKESEKLKGVYYRSLSEEEILQSQKEIDVDLLGDGSFVIKSKTPRIVAEPTDSPIILHVHHKYYVFGDAPWEYPDEAVVTLCHECHFEVHSKNRITVYADETLRDRLTLTTCPRCLGTGFLKQYYYHQNGICFKCGGRKYMELTQNASGAQSGQSSFREDESERIERLQQELYKEAEILHHVSKSIQAELQNNDPEAEKLLATALRHAQYHFREIGYELNAYGGFELMQNSIYKISNAGFNVTVIEHAWDGIGTWMV